MRSPIIRALIPVSTLVQGVYYLGKPRIYVKGASFLFLKMKDIYEILSVLRKILEF